MPCIKLCERNKSYCKWLASKCGWLYREEAIEKGEEISRKSMTEREEKPCNSLSAENKYQQ